MHQDGSTFRPTLALATVVSGNPPHNTKEHHMSTSSESYSTAYDTASGTPVLAAASLAVATILTAIGSFWSRSIKNGVEHSVSEWLITVAIAAVATAIVFGLVVRTAARGNAGRRSLVLGIVAVLSLAVFWAGIPPVLSIGSLACALVEKDRRGSFGGMAVAGLVLSALVLCVAIAAAFLA